MTDLDKMILRTFIDEENTFFQVENYLNYKGITQTREQIKSRLGTLLDMGLVKLFDDPSGGKVNFKDSNDEFEEDYWFVLTEEGKSHLNV
ncbi:hypothetical protein [Neobacillus sp.]|uniref:hypothetical protein n=1 Tax=Neobacillus sp. TaxID=2675273 RepID=UPI00289D0CBA|nr:hypothetical protein [Neobacillus sp.]